MIKIVLYILDTYYEIFYNNNKNEFKVQNGVHHQKGVSSHFVLFLFYLKGGERMKVNGKIISLQRKQNLYDFLISQNLNIHTLAVERNGEIIPKSKYKDILLKEEDSLEIVQFIGGG